MNIRWRLIILFIQLSTLMIFTRIVSGRFFSAETWFVAGILAVIINPQLLEPYYPRPADVIGNSILSLVLIATTQKKIAVLGWNFLMVFVFILLIIGIIATVLGAGRKKWSVHPIARAATIISREATALRIYSLIFWLALVEAFPINSTQFWLLGLSWGIIVILNSVNWQRVWTALSGSPADCAVEGMIGPSYLIINSPEIPAVGSWVHLKSDSTDVNGVIASRIKRSDDVWGQIHITSQQECEALVRSSNIHMSLTDKPDRAFLGSVFAGSDDTGLIFYPVQPLNVGSVVSVQEGSTDILYQINSAKIDQTNVKGGSQLNILARATQIGVFDTDSLRLKLHRWVPSPGAPVVETNLYHDLDLTRVLNNWILLGHVIGTEIPIFLDIAATIEGHLAILGMTKMGKTSLAHRIATRLSSEMAVIILDQTGEYRTKRQVAAYQNGQYTAEPRLSVVEPPTGMIAADFGCRFLEKFIVQARSEYEIGSPSKRVFLIDEAHQFVPEPAVLGYGGPGRESSLRFGALMMQVRKYGITIFLVSQRTAIVAKSALSQCENVIAFKSVDQTGLDYLETIAGNEARNILPRLQQGEALVFGPGITSESPVAIKVILDEQSTLGNISEIPTRKDSIKSNPSNRNPFEEDSEKIKLIGKYSLTRSFGLGFDLIILSHNRN